MLANHLASRSFNVLVWISDFEHYAKKLQGDVVFIDAPTCQCEFKPLHSCPYDSMISFGLNDYEKSLCESFPEHAACQVATYMACRSD